jgi:hypothetical protein
VTVTKTHMTRINNTKKTDLVRFEGFELLHVLEAVLANIELRQRPVLIEHSIIVIRA